MDRGSRARHARAIMPKPGWLGTSLLLAVLACYGEPQAAFTQLVEARLLAADMRFELHRAADAEARAVLADQADAAAEFAAEANAASAALRADVEALGPLLDALRYEPEAKLLAELQAQLVEIEAGDRELLALAAENSNVEAQRLAFGPGDELADRVWMRAQAAAVTAAEADALRAELLATQAALAIRELQALQGPHIVEPDDAKMTQIEARMAVAAAAARGSLEELSALVPEPGREEAAGALADFDRFEAVHREIVSLSRRNTDVEAFALVLGRQRELDARADATLDALEKALAKRGFRATR
jgi:hypothetical protein